MLLLLLLRLLGRRRATGTELGRGVVWLRWVLLQP